MTQGSSSSSLLQTLTHQFDLELLLKRHELRVISQEISYVEKRIRGEGESNGRVTGSGKNNKCSDDDGMGGGGCDGG